MDVQAYLSFQGRTQEALDFYTGAIGAKVDMVMRFKDGPPEMQSQIAPDMKEKVMHAAFHVGNTQHLRFLYLSPTQQRAYTGEQL